MTTTKAVPAYRCAETDRRAGRPASSLEVLEARIAPAAVTSPGVVSYTDSDGDRVDVRIEGKFKSVAFLTAGGADALDSGGDLASVIVTGARSDFALTFVDVDDAGDGVIDLGVISGPSGAKLPAIKGVFTIPAGEKTTFELAGYKGAGFSKGGGLQISGDLVAVVDGNGGLELDKIQAGAVVSLHNIAPGTLVAVKGSVAGTLNITGDIESSIVLGGIKGTVQLGMIASTVTVDGSVAGRLSVAQTTFNDELAVPVGLVRIQDVLSASGVVTAGERLNLQVDRDLSGVIRVQGDLFLSAGKGVIGAEITVGNNLSLDTVGGLRGSTLDIGGRLEVESEIGGGVKDTAITGWGDLSLAINGSVINSRIVGSAHADISVGSSLQGSDLSAGADLTLGVAKDISKSEVLPDGTLILSVGTENYAGGITKSEIGSREETLELAVAGKVNGSSFYSGDFADIEVGANWKKNTLFSALFADLTVHGNVIGSRVTAGDDITVVAGKEIASSRFFAANELDVTAGASGISSSRLETSEGNSLVTSTGRITKTTILAGLDADVSVDAGVASDVLIHASQDATISAATKKVSAKIAAGRDITVLSEGAFTGAIRAGRDLNVDVDRFATANSVPGSAAGLPEVPAGVRVGGDLTLRSATDVKARLIEVDGDLLDLRVGRNFDATIRIGGDLTLGEEGINVTAVAGSVSAGSLIRAAGDFGNADSAAKVTFAGAFKGRLEVDGDLVTDLEFGGSVSSVKVDGRIGGTPLGDGIAQIIVNGNVNALKTGSVFNRADAGGGTFTDGAGTITGTLQATGNAKTVTMAAL